MLFEFDQRSDAMHLPIWIPQAVVPIAMLLIVVLALQRIFIPQPAPDADQSPHGAA
jgi:TRAP-type C4-dicarboxylate transport system permease small subunit